MELIKKKNDRMINEYGGIGGMRIATLSTIKPT
jgi:hypothetical protein